MNPETRKFLGIVAAYTVVASLVFGWFFNHPGNPVLKSCEDRDFYLLKDNNHWCDENYSAHIVASFAGSVIWPITLPMYIGINLTK